MLKSARASILALTFALLVAAATAGIVNSQTANGKYDTDGDGLIEVTNLEQLDAMRHDLDADGLPDADSGALAYEAAFPVTGAEVVCSNNCTGYELTRSLDFDDAASYSSGAVNPEWTTGGGWLPGGLSTTFDGNGNTISNLYINRTGSDANHVGLFSTALSSSAIRSIGLVDIDVTGSLSGNYGVGGLVGRNTATISDSYATGSVTGTLTDVDRSDVGVGGLVGVNRSGTIMDSYATGRVSGTLTGTRAGAWRGGVGGLVGSNDRGNIGDSHAASNVVASGAEGIGGLVGRYYGRSISNSHATGSVEGSQAQGVGGLVGHYSDYSGGSISNSHATTSVTGNVISITTSIRTVYGGVGGLVGYINASGSISNSHATGNVEGSGGGGVGGLVGYISASGNISQSYATGSVTGTSISRAGGLVGRNSGDISDSHAIGNVEGSGSGDIGGLVGSHFRGSITRSHASGSVEGSQSEDQGLSGGIGGLVGDNGATISHSYATGSVTGTRFLHVGALVGRNIGRFLPSTGRYGVATLRHSYATGRVTGPMSRFVGGLVGANNDNVSHSYATGSVEGSGSSGVGGLVGYANTDTISDSYATGSVAGVESRCVGGLVGYKVSGTTSASYATGSVTGSFEGSEEGGVGGLVACINRGTISESYSIGRVSGTNPVGGLAGRNNGGSISSSFWDTEASGQPTGSGVGIGSSAGILGRTTAQLQAPTGYTGIYSNWGDVDRWDFGASSQYPVLKVDFDGNGTATWQEFGSQRGDMVTLPGAPTGLTATANGQTQIDLSWSAPASDGGAAITGYRIEVSADGSAWSDLDADTGSTTTSHSNTGLTAGTTRHYQVSAINSAGTGPESNVASATTTLGDSLVDRYDANGNNMIDKAEVIEAINDYLFGAGDEAISKAEVIELINLYLFG